MRFTILGPVRAWLGDTELETGPPTQRALLALLLVHAGQPVALADIVDTLWGDDPPRTAVNIVHRHVGTLRRLFDPDLSTRETGRLLLPSSGGYRMDVDAASLDLLMFRRLAERAYEKRDLTLFDTALTLWHGRIADGIQDHVRAHPAFVAAEREYVTVALDAARIALELGHPERFVPALKLVAAANPFNEAVQARLVTALAAMGNQAEAMDTYQRTRDLLVDELGIDPGIELRAAYARIQQPRKKPAVPTQLPGDLPTFTGRRTELAVTESLHTGQAMTTLAIFGMPGIGKTTLAVHMAHELADRFPDGQLYVNLRGFDPVGAVSSSNAVRGFLETLGVAPNRMPADLDGQAALYRSLLAGKRVLVVLDDARDTEHVRSLLPGSPGCMVIITSRTRLGGLVARTGAYPLALGLPTFAEARDIFIERLGAQRVAAEMTAVDEIIALCGRLPLAMAIVAARAAMYPEFSLTSMVDELRGGALDAFSDADPDMDVRMVFSWSYRTVSPEAARLFRLLGLHPGPTISVAAAASLAAVPVRQTRALLDDLTAAHLINELLPGRYVFHDLLRAYATELGVEDADEARGRLLDHYLTLGDTASTLLFPYRDQMEMPQPRPGVVVEPFADNDEAAEQLTVERPVFLVMASYAVQNGFPDHAWRIAHAVEIILDRQGRWRDQMTLQTVAISAATGNRAGLAHAHRSYGYAAGQFADMPAATEHLSTALELFAKDGNIMGLALTHRHIAYLANRQGHHQRALDHYRKATALYDSIDNQAGQGSVRNEVGWTYILLGEYEQALACCQRAVTIQRAAGNRNGEASAADSVGYAYHHLGRYRDAITHYHHALTIYRQITDRYLEADTLTHIGDSQAALGDRTAAAEAWRAALEILTDLDHPEAGEVRGKLRVIGADPDVRPLFNGVSGG